ncbi:MAG TPA: DUF3037 domain-containing protein [Ignavibacteriaceae bacterium]|nr:DUF3037 domain-containing protein [Ignavibacteriaceae bacterium]
MQNLFYDYAVIRIVPKVDREEFINAGVILFCSDKDFLKAGVVLDEKRLKIFDPGIEVELVRTHLDAIKAICEGSASAGSIGKLSRRERFHWLTSPKSTIIQTSPVHSGYCKNPSDELNELLDKMVKVSLGKKSR